MVAVIEETEILEDQWRGLYKDSWTGVIAPEAFAHPAKFSRALIRFIYQHVTDCGWVHPGDSVIDPFGGVALGGLDAMLNGLNWYGCELEEKFVGLGNQNIALWNNRYSRMPQWGSAILLQGDSRKLREVLQAAGCCVSSPPYVNSVNSNESGIDWDKAKRPERWAGNRERKGCQAAASHQMNYGASDGQLGAMKEGDLNIAISSPPFPQPYTSGGGINVKGYGDGSDKVGERTYQSKGGERSEGNLETMDAGGFQAAVSSPPWEAGAEGKLRAEKFKDPEAFAAAMQSRDGKNGRHGTTVNARMKQMERDAGQTYGDTENNLGNQRGEDFWSASRIILEQLYQVIVPGGHAVFVVKAFVRNKQIVDFPGQWAQLCEAVGFKLLHHHQALLTEDYGTQTTFHGEDKQLTVARKSFFRRLAESKGSPKIDWESVLCFERGTQQPSGSNSQHAESQGSLQP